jgi:hypothetical protein
MSYSYCFPLLRNIDQAALSSQPIAISAKLCVMCRPEAWLASMFLTSTYKDAIFEIKEARLLQIVNS